MNTPLAETRGLVCRYGARLALAGVDLDIPSSQPLTALLGPNGSGKSTLLRVLSTLRRPDEGSARVCGYDIGTEASAIRTRIGVVFQHPSLDGKLRVRENLRHAGWLHGLHGRELNERIAEVADILGFADRMHDMVETLSGGLQRRVEIAKCLLIRPRLILMDEPSTGLDPTARQDMWTHLRRLTSAAGPAIIFSTHLLDEALHASRVILLHEGKLIAHASPQELREEIPGQIIQVDCPDKAAATALAAKYPRATAAENIVRIHTDDAAPLMQELSRELGRSINSLSASTATLEDVFFHKTGRRLDS